MSPRGTTARWLLPPAASLALHAGLLIALTAVTIEVTRDRTPPRPQRVTLSAPPAPPAAPTTPAVVPTDAAPDPGAFAPAEPQALTDAVTQSGPAPARQAAAPVQLAPAPVTRAILQPENAGAPRVSFAEIDAAPARTVVFVVDASGAVATAFTFVREELLRSIDQLSPTQRFQVIVFPGPDNSDPVTAPINRGRLALATPAHKRAVAEWMTTFRPRGRSAPLEGLERALALKPDIAMLITRSIERTGPDAAWGDGLDATMRRLDQLNPVDRRTGERRTAIAAVQLLDEDPTGIMPAIAGVHGSGVSDYRVVTADNLASPHQRIPRATGSAPASSIDAAASVLADLDDTGVALRVFQGLPDDADRARAAEQARRAADLAARTPDDPRARVLLARAQSMIPASRPPTDAIDTLRQELLHDPDADAWRRLALVDALAAADRDDEAVEELRALQADAAELTVSRPVRARIAVTAAALGDEPADPDDALQRTPFLDERGDTDPYWVLAMGEAMVRGRVRTHASDPFGPLLSLLDRAEREHADAWPPILLDRLARAAGMAPARVAEAPPRARLEIAAVWSRSPATRDRARTLFESLVGADTPQRPEALWRLGVLERSTDTPASRARAAGLLATLARAYPDDAHAPDALGGAIALTADTATLKPLLTLAVARLPDRPEIDLWRLRLAELSEGAARLDALEPVATGTRESTLARSLYADAAASLYEASTDPDTRNALTTRTAAFLARHDAPDAGTWLVRAADAARTTDPKASVDLARRALASAQRHARPTTDAELALSRALLGAGRPRDALGTLSALATRLDAANDRSPAFWEAWTLLLETGADADPQAARAHLARLRLTDPALGGDPWRTRLERLDNHQPAVP